MHFILPYNIHTHKVKYVPVPLLHIAIQHTANAVFLYNNMTPAAYAQGFYHIWKSTLYMYIAS